MQTSGIIDAMPLWLLYLVTAGVVLLAIEIGWRLGNRQHLADPEQKGSSLGAAVGATLGLLAFLLAFTFGMAANRYDSRKLLVLDEANAIGTVYLRADFLPEPQRSDFRETLRIYTTLRVRGVTQIMTPEIRAETATLHRRLWDTGISAIDQVEPALMASFVQSLNELIDLDESRVTAGRNRIPDTIWFVLYSVTILSMAAMGYQFGLNGERNWAVILLLTLGFTAVLVLIADLDRPQAGIITVSQQSLLDVIDAIGTPTP